uniref:(S)-coclaurine N-methyltransferase n=2 Tax=Thalictrum flavum TaxID=150094 RepID=CNMT_THLFG|nr:RecName: Full=(S)-coclaurine N-methyltransferase; Short=TfCNMT [Thalictrum flavum subsp. glaucum]AAU20766.1 (S)-coclaurine N-methyltransferase [Thalictrum flavum subsp. glaucum]ANY58203.1 CNMT [synthetic construct]
MAVEGKQVAPKKAIIVELLKKLELGLVPDDEIKKLIRIQLGRRLQWGCKSTYEEQIAQLVNLTHSLRQMKIATEVETLDDQMYEVPIDFLKIMNGSNLKGSCCYFKNDSTTLDEAEIAMLELYCERAQIKDGHSVLDLGCGQGALTLYVAQKYKNSRVTAVTNSVSQKEFIEEESRKRNLSNVEVLLADITTHKMPDTYDRILVVELFEHMKNYELLLRKIKEWMAKDGLLFVEHICHKTFAYHYEPIDEDDWFTEYVFPAGTMIIPSASFFLYFQDDVSVVNHWTLSGKHFSRTNEEWLKRLDANVELIKPMFVTITGQCRQEAMKLINYWRGFCLSGMEMFGYNNGEEWMASHVLFKKK